MTPKQARILWNTLFSGTRELRTKFEIAGSMIDIPDSSFSCMSKQVYIMRIPEITKFLRDWADQLESTITIKKEYKDDSDF